MHFLKNKKTIIILIIAVTIIILIGSFYAITTYKINQIPKMTYEEMLLYTTNNNKNAAISVGIIQNGQSSYTIYGENGTILPDKEYFYEIGSITKTFTASLICRAVLENMAQFDSSIDKYLNLSKKDYYPTIKSLLTHTSGYKNFYLEKPMISNFFKNRNDFYGINYDVIIERTNNISLKDKEYPFNYSNFAMAILGAILEEIYQDSYTNIVNSYAEELGLLSTSLYINNHNVDNSWEWAQGDSYMSAGALISTISDMLSYAKMQLEHSYDFFFLSQQLLAEVNATTKQNELMDIRIDAIAAGWIIDTQNNIIWHNGATSNYNSYIGFNIDKQTAVVILSNLSPKYRIPSTVMGIKLLKSLE